MDRLIDADRLLQETWKVETKDMFHITEMVEVVSAIDIKEAPTVKAIPIEWILKWACEFIDPNSEGYKMAIELVHDWRKENEENM